MVNGPATFRGLLPLTNLLDSSPMLQYLQINPCWDICHIEYMSSVSGMKKDTLIERISRGAMSMNQRWWLLRRHLLPRWLYLLCMWLRMKEMFGKIFKCCFQLDSVFDMHAYKLVYAFLKGYFYLFIYSFIFVRVH